MIDEIRKSAFMSRVYHEGRQRGISEVETLKLAVKALLSINDNLLQARIDTAMQSIQPLIGPSSDALVRVHMERSELMGKLAKLDSFLDSAASKELPLKQVELLRKQSKFMDSYADILSIRMDLMHKHGEGVSIE